MKFTIKGNIITIKYINNGKLKTMKLDIKDKIDLDFFNRLQQAKTDNQDSMCDMYQRNILKPNNKNTEHITPLVLTKELERPKIVKQQELQQRKQELEQDKKNIEEEAKTLLKQGIKLKDLKESEDLTDKVNDVKNVPILQDIISKYISIDKALNVVIQQAENVDIQSATNVNINEIKNATVKTYQQLEEFISKADISEKSQKELLDGLRKILGTEDFSEDTPINVGSLESILPTIPFQIGQKIRSLIDEDNLDKDVNITAGDIKKIVGEDDFNKIIPYLKNTLLLSAQQLNQIQTTLKQIIEQKDTIGETLEKDHKKIIKKFIKNLPKPIKTVTINDKTYDLSTYEALIEYLSNNTITGIKDLLYEAGITNPKSFTYSIPLVYITKKYLFAAWDSKDSDYTIIDDEKNLLLKILSLFGKDERYFKRKGYEKSPLYFKICAINVEDFLTSHTKDIANILISSFCLISKTSNSITYKYNEDLNLYFNFDIINQFLKQTTAYKANCLLLQGDITSYFDLFGDMFKNTQKHIKPKQTIQKISYDEDLEEYTSEESDEESEGLYSGKLDLSNATLDEKLNEIIQILSRMNYNVFTTTPMYKETKNKFNKESSTKKTNKDSKSKGIKTDLLTELDLM